MFCLYSPYTYFTAHLCIFFVFYRYTQYNTFEQPNLSTNQSQDPPKEIFIVEQTINVLYAQYYWCLWIVNSVSSKVYLSHQQCQCWQVEEKHFNEIRVKMTYRHKIYTSTFCLYRVKSLYGCQSVHLKCNISASRIQEVTNFGITSVRLFSFFNTNRNPHILCLDQHDQCYFREEEKFAFPKYTSSHPIFNGARVARSLILLHFVDRCLLFVL